MGIQKMKEAMVAAGLREPTFVTEEFIRATFQRSPEFALKEKKGRRFEEKIGDGSEGLAERLAESQKMILTLIIRDPRISKKAMAQAIGISSRLGSDRHKRSS